MLQKNLYQMEDGGERVLTKLIIISGPPGVGKSVVGSLLSSKLNNSAFLDADDVWRINPFEVNETTKNIVEQNITFVLRNYINAKYQYVILAWVLHRQSIIDRVLSRLGDLKFNVQIFTLIAEEGVLLDRLQKDKNIPRDHDRALDRLRESMILETEKIDTTRLEPNEIVKRILKTL